MAPTLVAYVPDHLPVTSTAGGAFVDGAEAVLPHPTRSKQEMARSGRSVVMVSAS
jgi:hypothetical protein